MKRNNIVSKKVPITKLLNRKKYIKFCQKLILTLIVGVLLSFVPASAQISFDFSSPPPTNNNWNWQLFSSSQSKKQQASVILDGKELFKVGDTKDHTALERVELIQSGLQAVINSPIAPEIRIEKSNELPVLYLNGQHLLTVTGEDTVEQETPLDRARLWKEDLQKAIEKAQWQRTPQYLQRQLIIAGVILICSLLLNRFLDQLQKYPLRQALARVIPGIGTSRKEQSPSLTVLFRFKLGLVQLGLWLVMIFIITDLFPFTRHWRYQVVNLLRVSLSTTLLTLGDREITIIGFLLFIIFFGGLFISTGILTNLLRTRILQVTRINRGAQEVISVIIRYCLLFFGTIVLLQFFGVNLSSLAIIGSAFGVGIGFGFQDIAKNFASGIVLLFERSIQVGDFIQVDDHMGTVERVGARSIVLKTLDRISIIVPNSRLLADEVINWSHGNPASRIHIPIGVAYGSDAQKVKSALLQAASEHPEVLRYPQPQVFFTSFGDSSLDFELLVWTSDPSRQQPLISDLYFQIEKIFRQQEIQIPFPQRDLHLRTGNLPVTLSPQFENYLAKLLNNLTAQRFQNSKPSNSSKKLN